MRPLLVERCFKCHGGARARQPQTHLREGILQGGDNGPAAVPGNPADSLLVKAVHWSDALKMPKDGSCRKRKSPS